MRMCVCVCLPACRAIREARKLRTAAEQQPELEAPVLAEIRDVIGVARYGGGASQAVY